MTDIEQQLVRAYANERFELPGAALAGLVRRRRRRSAYTSAAVAVLAAAGILIGVDQLRVPEPQVTGAFGVTAEAATCFRHTGADAPPAAAFTLTDDPGRRLVVAADDRHAVACTEGGEAIGLPWFVAGELDFAYGGSETAGLAVIGTAPAGTERLRVELLDGARVPALMQDGWFAAWQPGPGPYPGIRVTAYTPTGEHSEEVVIG